MSDFYKKYAYFYAKIAHMAAVKKNIPLSLLELNEGQLSVIDPETNRQVGLPRNPRWIRDARFEALKKSIEDAPEMLDLREILVYSLSGIKGKDGRYIVIGGNMRLRALRELGYAEAPCKVLDPATPMEKLREYTIKDNEGFGQNDFDILVNEWDGEELSDWGLDCLGDWSAPDGEGAGSGSDAPENGSLQDRFVVPPFSVLDTRKGYWQARKKVWRELIGDMGESRNDTLIQSPEIKYKDLYLRTRKHREELGLSFQEYLEKYVPDDVKEREAKKVLSQGVSLLDPVMAELVCRWFGVDGRNKTFDCFAGDSVFGYVSAHLGNEFVGIELRPEQAQLNSERVEGMTARYICDDGQNVAQHIPADSQDLLFSCPPYFDLEKYSDLPNDASNQKEYTDFIAILRNAFTAAIGCLKENRFAVIVVGDVRDKSSGFYYDFCGDIKRIFKDAGMNLYNEIILIETGASTALRAARYMESRKVAKMHQNILVFYKGKPKDIKQHFKKIEYASEDLELFRVDSGNEPAETEGTV